jgi:hexulose-6-phosphate isomerase
VTDLSRRDVIQVAVGSVLLGKFAGAGFAERVVLPGDVDPAAAGHGAPRSAAAQAGAGAGGGRRPIRKALKYGMIGEGDTVEAKFRLAKACGFDGVEMDSPNGLDRDEVLAAKASTGLEIPGVVDSVHWSKPLSHPDAAVRREGIEGLKTALRDCRAYGGDSVLLVPAVVNKGISYGDAYTRSQAAIREVLPLARELGVFISMENVWNNFLLSPIEAARFTDELDPEICGWHFDVGNIVAYGWPEHWIEVLGPRIRRLDVKEYSRQKLNDEGRWAGFNVEIGEGDCDWPAVMKSLDAVPYTGGWMAAEVGGGGEARLRDIATRMDRIIAG